MTTASRAWPMAMGTVQAKERSPLESLLTAIAEDIDVPLSAYQEADERYNAVGEWLCCDGSPLSAQRPVVYPQGSFALGTVVRPLTGEDYDIDAVVELSGPKAVWSAADLKMAVGARLRESGVYGPMMEEEGRRCWTLRYATGSSKHGFHMDLLPGVLLADEGPGDAKPTAIAITSRDAGGELEWRESDPKAYATWFRHRMQPRSTRRLLSEKVAGVEGVPRYHERVPLQFCVQLLKRFRDVLFKDEADHAPISVILTTLATLAYEGEDTLEDTFFGVLNRMGDYVESKGGTILIRNPTRDTENFADRWEGDPEKQRAFLRWLDASKRLRDQLRAEAPERLGLLLNNVLGESTARTTLAKYAADRAKSESRKIIRPVSSPLATVGVVGRSKAAIARWASLLAEASHRQAPCWPMRIEDAISIRAAIVDRSGAVVSPLSSGGAVRRGTALRFEATPRLPGAQIFWQVTNTGDEALDAGKRRGHFEPGSLVKVDEVATYVGTHFVECFAIQDGICRARSGEFVVLVT